MQSLRETGEILASLDSRTDSVWQDARINEFLDKFGKFTTVRELLREGADLFWGRNLPGEQEPEHALRDDLLAVNSGWELLLAIWDGQSVEADTLVVYVRNRADSIVVYANLVRVENGALPEQGLETPHTANEVFNLG